MDQNQFEFFKLNYHLKDELDSLFSSNTIKKDLALLIEQNYKNFTESEVRQKRLSDKVDRRSISIFEAGLLDLKLKLFIKQCGQDHKDENSIILDQICSNYWTYLAVRGDGNCFYRAFMLSYILKISMSQSSEDLYMLINKIMELKEIKYIIEQQEEIIDKEQFKSEFSLKDSSETLEQPKENEQSGHKQQQQFSSTQKYQIDTSTTESVMKEYQPESSIKIINEEMQVVTLSFLLQLLIQKEKKNEFDVQKLLEYYNSNPDLDISLIVICKNLLLTEYENMKQDNNCKEFIDDSMTNEITTLLTKYGESAQDLVFFLAARAFKCRVEVQNIYFDNENNLIHNLLAFDSPDQNIQEIQENQEIQLQQQRQNLQISVWYTGGHYDILFDKLFSEQNMNFCFGEMVSYKTNDKQDIKLIEAQQDLDNSIDTIPKQELQKNNSYILNTNDYYQSKDLFNGQISPVHNNNNNGQIDFGMDLVNFTVGDTSQQNQYGQFGSDNIDKEDEKIIELNKIQKSTCFICEQPNKLLISVQFEQNFENICKDCFCVQYNQYKLEENRDTILNLKQIQNYIQQILSLSVYNSQCIICNLNIEKQEDYQKLILIDIQNGLPLNSQYNESVEENNQHKIEEICQNEQDIKQSEEIEECKTMKNIEEDIFDNPKQQIKDYCLFCLPCLKEQILNKQQIIYQNNYSIYLQFLEGEVEFAFNESLYNLILRIIEEEYLKKAELSFENFNVCQTCNNQPYEIQLHYACTNDIKKIKICSYCLNQKGQQNKNPLYNNQNRLFFQTQEVLSYLEYLKINHEQCLICNRKQDYSNENKCQTQEGYFEFTFLQKQLSICSFCIFNIKLQSPQEIGVIPTNFEDYQTLFLGQKQIYRLLMYISSICSQCKQQKTSSLQLKDLLSITNIDQSFFCCIDCQQQNNLKYYRDKQNIEQNIELDRIGSFEQTSSMQNCVSQSNLDNINQKRSHNYYEDQEISTCIACQQYPVIGYGFEICQNCQKEQDLFESNIQHQDY